MSPLTLWSIVAYFLLSECPPTVYQHKKLLETAYLITEPTCKNFGMTESPESSLQLWNPKWKSWRNLEWIPSHFLIVPKASAAIWSAKTLSSIKVDMVLATRWGWARNLSDTTSFLELGWVWGTWAKNIIEDAPTSAKNRPFKIDKLVVKLWSSFLKLENLDIREVPTYKPSFSVNVAVVDHSNSPKSHQNEVLNKYRFQCWVFFRRTVDKKFAQDLKLLVHLGTRLVMASRLGRYLSSPSGFPPRTSSTKPRLQVPEDQPSCRAGQSAWIAPLKSQKCRKRSRLDYWTRKWMFENKNTRSVPVEIFTSSIKLNVTIQEGN